MKRIFGKQSVGGLRAIEVEVDGQWQWVTDRHDMEAAIASENSSRFQLTQDTPLMSQKSAGRFGFLAELPDAYKVWHGTLLMDGLSEETKFFLENFKDKGYLTIDSSVSCNDFRQYWGKARESTASSVSTLHFGHYKSVVSRPTLTHLHSAIVHLAFNYGVPLPRWARGMSCMLEKKEGAIRVNKLRAILLIEADFNFATKLLFGRRLQHRMEDVHAIPQEQLRSRNQHGALEVAVSRRICMDISRQSLTPLGIIGADVANCYDQMVHSFLIIRCWSLQIFPLYLSTPCSPPYKL